MLRCLVGILLHRILVRLLRSLIGILLHRILIRLLHGLLRSLVRLLRSLIGLLLHRLLRSLIGLLHGLLRGLIGLLLHGLLLHGLLLHGLLRSLVGLLHRLLRSLVGLLLHGLLHRLLTRSRRRLQCRFLVFTTNNEECNQSYRNHQERYAQQRSVEEPCDGNHDERPSDTQDGANESHTKVHDTCQERNYLHQGHEETEDALQTTDNEQDAQYA